MGLRFKAILQYCERKKGTSLLLLLISQLDYQQYLLIKSNNTCLSNQKRLKDHIGLLLSSYSIKYVLQDLKVL